MSGGVRSDLHEFDRIYWRLFDRMKAEYGRQAKPMFDGQGLKMSKKLPSFIKEIERKGDRIKAEVGGRLYWIIYDEDPRWEEIAE
jgi:hypothetical protein